MCKGRIHKVRIHKGGIHKVGIHKWRIRRLPWRPLFSIYIKYYETIYANILFEH